VQAISSRLATVRSIVLQSAFFVDLLDYCEDCVVGHKGVSDLPQSIAHSGIVGVTMWGVNHCSILGFSSMME